MESKLPSEFDPFWLVVPNTISPEEGVKPIRPEVVMLPDLRATRIGPPVPAWNRIVPAAFNEMVLPGAI